MSTVIDDYGNLVQTGSIAVRVGQAIRAARAAKGITQKILAERLEVSQSVVSKIEYGRHKQNVQQIANVAAALGVTVGSLFGEVA